MSPSAIFSQYFIFTVTFLAFYIDYAHSFPNVPGKQFAECFQFLQVVEDTRSVQRLALDLADTKHICSIEGTGGNSFCFVVSALRDGEYRSVCYEFGLLDLQIWRFKYPRMLLKIVVLRNGNVRWYFHCEVADYNDVKRFYSLMKYGSNERLTQLGAAQDLQKKTGLLSAYEIFATTTSVLIDESAPSVKIIHIVHTRLGVHEPLIIIWPLAFSIYTPEEEKVYMSLREYPSELYFFTCASPDDAGRLSDNLGRYSRNERAIFRTNPVIFF